MYRIFRQLRDKTLKSKKVLRYLTYAIGEIVLVVIGIVIALQLNNYNEARQKREDFMIALHEVEKDLRNDIAIVDYVIEHCEFIDSLSTIVMENRATAEMYSMDNSRLPGIVVNVRDIKIHQNGYNLVQKILEFTPNEYDTMVINLTQLYIEKAPEVDRLEEELKALSSSTLTHWRDNYKWFSSVDRYADPSAINYFLNDWNYKNRVQYSKALTRGYKENLHRYREASLNTLWLMRQIAGTDGAVFLAELSDLLKADTIKVASCPSAEMRDRDSEKDIYSIFIFQNRRDEQIFLFDSDTRPLSNVQHDRYRAQNKYLEAGELAFVTDLAGNEVYIKDKNGECLGTYTTGTKNGIVIVQ